MASSWRKYVVTLIVSVVALFAHASPTLAGSLELDFAAVGDGQWWRVVTGHLTHYDGQHLFWDLLMFIVLGAICERRHGARFAIAAAIMAIGISAAIHLWCPDILVYRGLSGMDTGLFVWFIVDQCRLSWQQRDRVVALLWLVPAVGLVGKSVFEAATGQTLFVDSSDFTPLVQSHLAGAAIGWLISVREPLCRLLRRPDLSVRLDADVLVP